MDTVSRFQTDSPVWTLYRMAAPIGAGVSLLLASLLPWIIMPLQPPLSAWQLQIDLGWQVCTPAFNYGVLCTILALYAFFIAYRIWYASKLADNDEATHASLVYEEVRRAQRLAVGLCLIPVFLFLWQYLLIDMGSMVQLSRQETQFLLMNAKFGYGTGAQIFPISDPIDLDVYDFRGRFILLIDQIGVGFFIPLASALLLYMNRKMIPHMPKVRHDGHQEKKRFPLWGILALAIVFLVLIRAPLALVCVNQATYDLSTGANASALSWLDRARLLNPSLDQLASYHAERGQALYFLLTDDFTPESHFYLARNALIRQDYLTAYQELRQVQQKDAQAPWVRDELSATLERLMLLSKPLSGNAAVIFNHDDPSLAWVQQLLRVDPNNVYGYYLLGRIQYDSHSYSDAETSMRKVIDLSRNSYVLSSAYTYIGLSYIGRGNIVEGRSLLLQAARLDNEYRNNTAREELSGLR